MEGQKINKKKALTAAERQRKARERSREWRTELADRGLTEVTLVLSQRQLELLNRYSRLTRILPHGPGEGMTTKEFLLRLTQPSLKRFEARFDALEKRHGALFTHIEALRDLSKHLSDKQFKTNKKVDLLCQQYLNESDPAKAAELLDEQARLLVELEDIGLGSERSGAGHEEKS